MGRQGDRGRRKCPLQRPPLQPHTAALCPLPSRLAWSTTATVALVLVLLLALALVLLLALVLPAIRVRCSILLLRLQRWVVVPTSRTSSRF